MTADAPDRVASSRLGRRVAEARARQLAVIVRDELDRLAARIGAPPPRVSVVWTGERFRNGDRAAAAFIAPGDDENDEPLIVLNARAMADEWAADSELYARSLAVHEAAHWVAWLDGEDLRPWPKGTEAIDRHAHGPTFRDAAVKVGWYASGLWPDPPPVDQWRDLALWPMGSLP